MSDEEETDLCDHCGCDERASELEVMGYGLRFCGDCSCMDEDEFNEQYGE